MQFGYIQRVVPSYRRPLFDLLGRKLEGELEVFAGNPIQSEQITVVEALSNASLYHAKNRYLSIKKGRYFLCAQTNVIRWLSTIQPKLVVCEANPRLVSNFAVTRWMKRRRRLVFGHGLGTMQLGMIPSFLRRYYHRIYLSIFDGMIAYSSRAAREYLSFGFPEHRVLVAVNAVQPIPKMEIKPRATCNVVPRVVFLGRLIESKKPIDLVIAASLLSMPIEVVFIGDGPERSKLCKRANELNVKIEIKGHLEGEELVEALEECDLCVMPGLGGLALQDAMASGLPVIVGDGDGTQFDYVTPSTGWHLEDRTPAGLAEMLKIAVHDRHRLATMRKEAFDLVSSKYNIESLTDNLCSFMKNALSEYK